MYKYIMGLLCSIFPIIAMESHLTPAEYEKVHDTLYTVFHIQQRKFDPYSNPIAVLTNTLKNYFIEAQESFPLLIDRKKLQSRLDRYKKVDSHILIQGALQQIKEGYGDNPGVKQYIMQIRCMLSGLELQKMQPKFSPAGIDELKDRVGWFSFMQRNSQYPCRDTQAALDYIALFIYQEILAYRIE